MIEIGRYNVLTVKRKTRVGLFLSDKEGNEILLPNKYIPENDCALGEDIRVFCYLDNEERPVATTLQPYVIRDDFGFLRVAEVNEIGAFLDWGLEKNLLVPFREQRSPMKAGHWYVVFCYLDPKSSRLVATSRLERFLDNSEIQLETGEEVKLLITRRTDLGWETIVNGKHKGLIYEDDIFQDVSRGDKLLGYVRKLRTDNKLDITLQPLGHHKLESSAQAVLDRLLDNDGVLNLHDKSDPQEIKDKLQMSKKTFKKAIGILYKARKIVIREDGIYKA